MWNFSLPSHFINFFFYKKLFCNLNFEYISPPPCSSPLLPNRHPPSCPIDPHLIPSLSLSSSLPLLSSLYPSFSETDNKTSFSMADPQFTPTSTPSQIADRGWVTAPDPMWCRTVLDPEPDLGPAGASAPVAGLLSSAQWWRGHTDSRNVYNTHIMVPSKEIPLDSDGIKDAILSGKREECCNAGKRKSRFTDRDLQLHLGRSASSPVCPYLRKKLLSAFLTTLIWHSHITDLLELHVIRQAEIIVHVNQMLQRGNCVLLPGSSAKGGAPVSK